MCRTSDYFRPRFWAVWEGPAAIFPWGGTQPLTVLCAVLASVSRICCENSIPTSVTSEGNRFICQAALCFISGEVECQWLAPLEGSNFNPGPTACKKASCPTGFTCKQINESSTQQHLHNLRLSPCLGWGVAEPPLPRAGSNIVATSRASRPGLQPQALCTPPL